MKKLEQLYWSCRNWFRDVIFEPVWYRFFGHKHHIIKTKLPPSSWYDTDERMLYGVMALVEWFVENDMQSWTNKQREDELKRIKEEDPAECQEDFNKTIKEQWARDDAIKDIYYWWKSYDRKQEEIEASLHEWHSYVESKIDPKNKDSMMSFMETMQKLNENKDEKEAMLSKKHNDLEKALEEEEQEMLKKAVELRGSMWS